MTQEQYNHIAKDVLGMGRSLLTEQEKLYEKRQHATWAVDSSRILIDREKKGFPTYNMA